MEWKIEELLPPEAIELMDQNDISIISVGEQGKQLYVEIEFYSSRGGDQVFTIWFDKPGEYDDVYDILETFKEGVYEVYESFDVDEYVALWLENRNGCPLNARQLVEDAYEVEQTLKDLYDELQTL